jgi:hypothetical protein
MKLYRPAKRVTGAGMFSLLPASARGKMPQGVSAQTA